MWRILLFLAVFGPGCAQARMPALDPCYYPGKIAIDIVLICDGRVDTARLSRADHLSYTARRAVALEERNRPVEALAAYDTAIDLDADFGFLLYRRGRLRTSLGQYVTALEDLDRAVELTLADTQDHTALKALLMRQRVLSALLRIDEALDTIDRIEAMRPKIKGGDATRARLFARDGRFEQAGEALARALAAPEIGPRARASMAMAWLTLGTYNTAVAVLNDAAPSDRGVGAVRRAHGMIACQRRNFEGAAAVFAAMRAHHASNILRQEVRMRDQGFNPGPLDGVWDARSRRAEAAWILARCPYAY